MTLHSDLVIWQPRTFLSGDAMGSCGVTQKMYGLCEGRIFPLWFSFVVCLCPVVLAAVCTTSCCNSSMRAFLERFVIHAEHLEMSFEGPRLLLVHITDDPQITGEIEMLQRKKLELSKLIRCWLHKPRLYLCLQKHNCELVFVCKNQYQLYVMQNYFEYQEVMVDIGVHMLLAISIEKFPVQLFLFLPQRDKKEILSSICYTSQWYMLTFTLQSPKPRSSLLNLY